VKNVFVHVAQPVFCIVHPAFDFVPDHAIPKQPSLAISKLECYAPRHAHESLVFIRIPQIQPEGAFRFEHSFHFERNRSQVFDKIPIVMFKTDPTVLVFAFSPIRRRCHCTVDRTCRNLSQDRKGITFEKERRNRALAGVVNERLTVGGRDDWNAPLSPKSKHGGCRSFVAASVLPVVISSERPEPGFWQVGLTAKELAMVGNTPCTLSRSIVATVNRLQKRFHLWIGRYFRAMSVAQVMGEYKAKRQWS